MTTAETARTGLEAGALEAKKDRQPNHKNTDQEGDERWQDMVVDADRRPDRQHSHEMHGPDGNGQRQGRPRQQQLAPTTGAPRQFQRQVQPHIGALDGHQHRQGDDPGLVIDDHRRAVSSASAIVCCRARLSVRVAGEQLLGQAGLPWPFLGTLALLS
jgi:hypothetical protein